MAAEDSAVLKHVWDGKIPICFTLAQEDLSSEDRVPSPVYLLVPRLSYFPLVTERVIRHFIGYTDLASHSTQAQNTRTSQDLPEVGIEVDSQTPLPESTAVFEARSSSDPVGGIPPEHQVWLEFSNQPLKWHYPVGLLFDLTARSSDLPWKITVHFTGYPIDVLLSPPVHRQAVESHFMSLVKEADALKHRSHVMNQMQPRDHRQLWNGLLNYQFDKFWAINRRLMEPVATNPRVDSPIPSSVSKSAAAGDTESPTHVSQDEPVPTTTTAEPEPTTDTTHAPPPRGSPLSVKAFRFIPLRLYRIGEEFRPEGTFASGYIQKRIQPFTSDGVMISLADAMRVLLNVQGDPDDDSVLTGYNFILHGITLPQNAPIQWISEHMSYADSFLHIVARPCD